MQFLLTIAPALLLAPLLAVITSAIPFPFDDPKKGFTPLNIRSADVAAQLGSRLSENATIYFQNDPRFANATARWSVYGAPNIAVVVEPGIETDVATIVRPLFKNPFLSHYQLEQALSNVSVERSDSQLDTIYRFWLSTKVMASQALWVDSGMVLKSASGH